MAAYLCGRLFEGGRLFEKIGYSETRVSFSPRCVSWRFLTISYQVTVGSVRYSPPGEKKCGFFAWTTTENWFTEMKSTTSQTVFRVTREVSRNLFSLRAQRASFPLEDWLAIESDWPLSAHAFILHCNFIKNYLSCKENFTCFDGSETIFMYLKRPYILRHSAITETIVSLCCWNLV